VLSGERRSNELILLCSVSQRVEKVESWEANQIKTGIKDISMVLVLGGDDFVVSIYCCYYY
jgi:hypothetical protein